MDNHIEDYSVKLGSIINEFKLEKIYDPGSCDDIKVICSDVNRPGLALCGFFDYFDRKRIQLLGHAEHHYLYTLSSQDRTYKFEQLGAQHPPAVIVTSGLSIFVEALEAAKKYQLPILRTNDTTSRFQAALIASLSVSLAPRITRHGVLVEVYGEGILILGDSGVGKSETAIELVKRGHRLIADDAVEIKRVSARTLVGTAPEMIRYYVELRGIGIIDVRRIFGMGAVNESEKIDMIVKLEQWKQDKMYDRLGLENETTNILGIDITTLTIPVQPGRNLAIILEIAAMNNRQKRMGYNTAEEFNKRFMERMQNPDKEQS